MNARFVSRGLPYKPCPPCMAVFCISLLVLTAGCHKTPNTAEITGKTMGTTYTVKAVVEPDANPETVAKLGDIVQNAVDEVNNRMSTFKQDSELSKFNQFQDTAPFQISREMMEVFTLAWRVSAETGGAFDVTVGPLVNAWGFGPPGHETKPPTDEELAALRERVGYEKVEIDPDACTLRKTRPDIYCDLSAIAKGYGVDQVAKALEAAGFQRYMVEVGGEVRTLGVNSAGEPWRIAIEQPTPDERSIEKVVPLNGWSMATSGDYRNFRQVDGQTFSHEIDPHTGRPIQHKLAAASVIAKDCATADAYATGMMVLGPEAGMALAQKEGLIVLLILHGENGGFKVETSRAFDQFINPE